MPMWKYTGTSVMLWLQSSMKCSGLERRKAPRSHLGSITWHISNTHEGTLLIISTFYAHKCQSVHYSLRIFLLKPPYPKKKKIYTHIHKTPNTYLKVRISSYCNSLYFRDLVCQSDSSAVHMSTLENHQKSSYRLTLSRNKNISGKQISVSK